jgi:hypothetical protein
LELLGGAGLLAALQKYAAEPFRRRASSPKLLALNTGLITAVLGLSPKEVWADAALMGRLVETAVGAHLLAHAPHGGFEVYYWRERDQEVDFVLKKGKRLLALEVKSAPSQRTKGLIPFYANAFVLGHQWNRVCRLRVSGSWARTRHRSATTSIISSRSRKYRLATASFTKGHTRSTGWSSGE